MRLNINPSVSPLLFIQAKPTTVEQLEKLDKEIKELEEFRAKNQRMLKLWVGRLLLYSSVIYLLTCLTVYYLYLPEQWSQRLFMSLPFFIFPVLVWFTRKLLIFLFSKRTERNKNKYLLLYSYRVCTQCARFAEC
uniref:Lunapark, ER junction formation factor n=1 Tax=Myripristis murdjan TaxID=586833 RepID=A0A667WLH4_9TELE